MGREAEGLSVGRRPERPQRLAVWAVADGAAAGGGSHLAQPQLCRQVVPWLAMAHDLEGQVPPRRGCLRESQRWLVLAIPLSSASAVPWCWPQSAREGKCVKSTEPLVFLLPSKRSVSFGLPSSPAGLAPNAELRMGCLPCGRGRHHGMVVGCGWEMGADCALELLNSPVT